MADREPDTVWLLLCPLQVTESCADRSREQARAWTHGSGGLNFNMERNCDMILSVSVFHTSKFPSKLPVAR